MRTMVSMVITPPLRSAKSTPKGLEVSIHPIRMTMAVSIVQPTVLVLAKKRTAFFFMVDFLRLIPRLSFAHPIIHAGGREASR